MINLLLIGSVVTIIIAFIGFIYIKGILHGKKEGKYRSIEASLNDDRKVNIRRNERLNNTINAVRKRMRKYTHH